MSKKTLVTAISISKETDNDLDRLQNKLSKNRSQLIRDLVDYYLNSSKNTPVKAENAYQTLDYSQPNNVLRHYYELISSPKNKKPTLVIGIGIVNKKDQVLIGLRKSKDAYVQNLTWTFPSGKFSTLDFESELVRTIRSETGYLTRIIGIVHARLIPDTFEKKIRIVAVYYHCKIISGHIRPAGDFKEVQWVPAVSVTRYFTTSVSDEVISFLGTL